VLPLANASGAHGCGCVVVITCACVQAILWCTISKARKVVVSLTVVALTAEAINAVCIFLVRVHVVNKIIVFLFKMFLPLAVLVINVVVARQVRRAATNAAANLGVQPHHQSTSSNSVVPTVMLIANSLIYVLFYSNLTISMVLDWWVTSADISYEAWVVGRKGIYVVYGIAKLSFAYNFYVYLITGKQFRSELYKLFCSYSCCCCCSSSSSSAAAAAAAAVVVVADDNDNPETSRRAQAETTF